MKRRTGPNTGSTAYNALMLLNELGGRATVAQLIVCIEKRYRSPHRFNNMIQSPLLLYKFLVVAGDRVDITELGRAFVRAAGVDVVIKPTAEPAAMVAPAYRPQAGTLDLARYMGTGPQRVGAQDYRDIPSLMGDERVPYQGGVHGIA